MTQFKSEPFKNFLDSHTRLNNYIKISTIAVDFLYNSKKSNEELSKLLNDLILKSGERWTPRIIKDPKRELKELNNDLSKTGIIWVYSAFDVFFKQVEGILSSSFSKEGSNKCDFDKSEEDTKQHKIVELYHKLGWEINDIENLLIILKFYEALRHSIAHNMGLPSGKLIEITNSNEFNISISNWKTKFPKKTISPPPIINEKIIELKPHHTIMYSETCLRIAQNINGKIYDQLGLEYFIGKTIKKHLLDPKFLTIPECQDLTRYLIYHLKNDFNISINPYKKIYEFCNDEKTIKEYKKRYATLKS